MFCHECIDFFLLGVPKNVFFTYSLGLCEGCFQNKMITNPLFWMKMIREKKATVLIAQAPEKTLVSH